MARIAVAAAVAIAVALQYGNWVSARRVSDALQEAARLSKAASGMAVGANAAAATDAANAAALDPHASLRAVFHTIARAGASLAVSVATVSASAQADRSRDANPLEMSLQFRGGYANTKLLLAEALDRYPALIVSRMSMRALPSGGEVDAQLTLLLPAAGATAQPARP